MTCMCSIPPSLQKYEDALNNYNTKKDERRAASKELKRIKDHYQPIKEKHSVQEKAVDRFLAAAQEAMGSVRKADRALRENKEKLVALGDKVEEPRQELENAKKQDASRRRKIENLQREIEVGFV